MAIRNQQEKVVYKLDEVLGVWEQHFSTLCTPRNEPQFDEIHYDHVTSKVKEYNQMTDSDIFLSEPFTEEEVAKAVKKLKLRKACGYDNICSEHIIYTGPKLVQVLTLVYNKVVDLEYVPINLRRGIQIPLFKGEKLCSLDVNNYRGITLLTNLNKIYEMILWARMEEWWHNTCVISRFQGACRRGQSCVHTAILLQETVSTALEVKKNVFVSYFDVSKAFDTVWTDGLFYKLYNMGITGRLEITLQSILRLQL